jgi:hypothetical protein
VPLECKIHIDRLKGDAHGAVSQLVETAVWTSLNFVVAESSWVRFCGANTGLSEVSLVRQAVRVVVGRGQF